MYGLRQSTFEVVKIVWSLLINEIMAVNKVYLLECEVSGDWVIFIKFNQWNALLEPFTPHTKEAMVTNDNRLLADHYVYYRKVVDCKN